MSEPQPASLADLPPERVPGGRTRFRGQRDGRRIESKDGFRLEPGWPAPRHAQASEGNIGRHEAARRHRAGAGYRTQGAVARSEEHTSELQSLMRISYAVFCLKKKKNQTESNN